MIVRRISNDELYHHGIKGQEWGVKNGPPYPLDAKGSSLRKQKKLYKKQEKEINKLRKAGKEVGIEYKKDINVVNRITEDHIKYVKKYYDMQMRAVNDKTLKDSKEYVKTLSNYKQNKYGVLTKAVMRGEIEQLKRKKKGGLTLDDIDDPELIKLYIDDPEFRKEYNVTNAQYKKYKNS